MTELVRLSDDIPLGPAMLALSDQQRRFVAELVMSGCNATEAARRAGYSDSSGDVLRASAWRVAHLPKVQAAIHEMCFTVLKSDAPLALGVLREVASDKSAAARDRVKAAAEILNRAGLHAVSERQINLTVGLSDAEKDREIAALCAELGLDDRAKAKLLGKPIDVEHVEVVDPPIPEIAPPRDKSGAPITNPERPPEERAKDRARYRMTPEEREAMKQQQREEASRRGKEIYAAAQAAREQQEQEFSDEVVE